MSSHSDNDILAYLDRYGVYDKDRVARSSPKRGMPKKPADLEHGKRGPRLRLDLHGLKSEEAERRIRAAVYRCKDDGVKELIIIHGRGHHSNPAEGPVLKNVVAMILENELSSLVQSHGLALPKDGGEGATVVLLA
jgi:DNA-nicking Smr family endonuclease